MEDLRHHQHPTSQHPIHTGQHPPHTNQHPTHGAHPSGQMTYGYHPPVTPPGLEAIYRACKKLYPEQPNPLQVAAIVKYWLGGCEPLDYISMYSNPGNPSIGVPPHWHYVSFGLSDLHGDNRVHSNNTGDGLSGFGFELTFRLKREPSDISAPTWPAALMQALARYVFQTENTLCSGDHIPWHSSLDGSESGIQHMLMKDDPQLQPIVTSHGLVHFIQIVGVCNEELQAAQRWNGPDVLDLIKLVPLAGGPWLITDMRRGECIFDLDPNLKEQLEIGIEMDGSNLSGVNCKVEWSEGSNLCNESHVNNNCKEYDKENRTNNKITDYESRQIKSTLKKGLHNSTANTHLNKTQDRSPEKHRSPNKLLDNTFSSVTSSEPYELACTNTLDSIHLRINQEAVNILPMALKGRLKHGHHFTLKSALNDLAVTFVPVSVVGSIVERSQPYASRGPWLQVLIEEDFNIQLQKDLSRIIDNADLNSAKTYSWPDRGFHMTIIPDDL